MKWLRRWGASFAALGLAASLLLSPHQGAASPIRWRMDPEESGDPDTPGGRQQPYAGLDQIQSLGFTLPIWLPTGQPVVLRIRGGRSLCTKGHLSHEQRSRASICIR
jgi:hypothetical protein